MYENGTEETGGEQYLYFLSLKMGMRYIYTHIGNMVVQNLAFFSDSHTTSHPRLSHEASIDLTCLLLRPHATCSLQPVVSRLIHLLRLEAQKGLRKMGHVVMCCGRGRLTSCSCSLQHVSHSIHLLQMDGAKKGLRMGHAIMCCGRGRWAQLWCCCPAAIAGLASCGALATTNKEEGTEEDDISANYR